jgi:hypothetical protein
MRVEESLNRRNDEIPYSLFHSTSLLFFASLCCSVREGCCCTLQRSSTSLLLLHNLNIPPSFKDFVCAHYICSYLFKLPGSLFCLSHLALCFSSLDFSSASCHLKEEWSVPCGRQVLLGILISMSISTIRSAYYSTFFFFFGCQSLF